jgi:hypothetical protein
MVMSKSSQVGIDYDHYSRTILGIFAASSTRGRMSAHKRCDFYVDSYSSLRGMPGVPDSLSDCLQSLPQSVLSRTQGGWVVGGVHAVLLVQETIGGQPVEMERGQDLRGLKGGL